MTDREHCQQKSPARVDCQAQRKQVKPIRKQGKAVCSPGNLPLAGKSFYLDLPSGKILTFMTDSVKQLGGVVESFLSKEVTCVVSGSREARQERWAEKQTGVVSSGTQAGTWPSAVLGSGRKGPSHKSMDTVLISRGKKLLHKAIRSQDSTCGNSILANARSWGVQIMHIDEMLSYIQRLESTKHPSKTKVKLLSSGLQPLKVARLKPPFLKIEDESRQLRPFLQQFKSFPELSFLALRRHSPFEPPQTSSISKAPEGRWSPSEPSPPSLCHVIPKTQKGYCECCKETFTELQTHLQSTQHKEFALDPSHYALVDHIISQLTNNFADVSLSSPLRLSLATCSGDPSGFQMDAAEGATVPPSGQAVECCVVSEVGQPVSLDSGLTHLLEDKGQLMELLLEMFSTPLPCALQCFGSPSDQAGGNSNDEPHKKRRMVANAGPKAVTSTEVEHGAAIQPQRLLVQPAVLSRKRKLSCTVSGQAQKKQVLTEQHSSERLTDRNLLPEGLQTDTTECPLSLGDCQTVPGHLGLSTVPRYTLGPACASPQLPQEGFPCCPPKPVIDTSCLKSPLQHLDQNERSAVCPYKEQDIWTPCNILSPNIEQRSVPGFPVSEHEVPKLLGSVVQHCSSYVGISELAQGVLPQQPGLGLGPCLPLPYCPLTSLPTEAKSSSSESEWDGPLLCVLASASRLPFKCPIDTTLLGTCVSMQDSSYDSHLSSVLWQTPEANWACKEDSGCQNSHTEMERLPFTAVGPA